MALSFVLSGFQIENLFLGEGSMQEKLLYVSGTIYHIDIDEKNADIRILPGEGDKIKITYSENKTSEYLFTEDGQGRLKIQKKTKDVFLRGFMQMKSAPLIIEIPKGDIESMDIRTLNSRVYARQLHLSQFRCESKNGTTDLKNMDIALDMQVKTINGNIILHQVSAGKSAEISSVNGKIELSDSSFAALHTESKNGKIHLDAVQVQGSLHAETINGGLSLDDISFENVLYISSENGSISANILGNEADYDMEISIKNGRSNVSGRRNPSAEHFIKAKTHNGGITIHFKNKK